MTFNQCLEPELEEKNVNYADADVMIVHAGTCSLKKQSDPEDLAGEIATCKL